MEQILEGNFYSPTKGNLSINEVIKEIFAYITEKPEKFYDVIVGCDSPSSEKPFFPVAVVILRKGEGGRFFLKKITYKNKKFFNWHQRVLEEVLLSIELALQLREKLSLKLKTITEPLDYQFRYIHADIGENGVTREMIKEVTGFIRGNGFEPKIKPEAYVASVVADRYT
ncbi:MAG: hypothetical protein COV26_01480 [Candidatus Nealsonbacteria bacterium CG10_big_fil_rev_8_21_14_0_10_36_23]|uniref:DUF458 domain-containing protein n=1 Tax=Candidatus Nealsonbacteria bacterium CG10_big_fil_rev_8_21_14_0_10_36_23 TaxID=1974709 RepID=A0A2H0TN92_9BACT|nr:MAG: hypothetical protein COV26_01480 [Candidatus Nealsonbacteria bacterium CG10_big_fil_rev_8_21_14_0_10_36_23]